MHISRRSEEVGYLFQKYFTEHGEDDAYGNGQKNYHRKGSVCLFLVALAEIFCDKRASARSEHKSERAEHHHKGINIVDRRERNLADVIGDEKTVHDAVDRNEYHHRDRRKREPQQLFIGKMVKKMNLHNCSERMITLLYHRTYAFSRVKLYILGFV